MEPTPAPRKPPRRQRFYIMRRGPSEALTLEQWREAMNHRDRPITQDPIQRRYGRTENDRDRL